MLKMILIAAIVWVSISQNAALGVETEGGVIFRDALYGAAIGALLGGAIYIVDQDDFGKKVATGVIIGTVGGLIYGVYETRSFVELEKDEIKVAVPTPVIEKRRGGLQYTASLFKTRF